MKQTSSLDRIYVVISFRMHRKQKYAISVNVPVFPKNLVHMAQAYINIYISCDNLRP